MDCPVTPESRSSSASLRSLQGEQAGGADGCWVPSAESVPMDRLDGLSSPSWASHPGLRESLAGLTLHFHLHGKRQLHRTWVCGVKTQGGVLGRQLFCCVVFLPLPEEIRSGRACGSPPPTLKGSGQARFPFLRRFLRITPHFNICDEIQLAWKQRQRKTQLPRTQGKKIKVSELPFLLRRSPGKTDLHRLPTPTSQREPGAQGWGDAATFLALRAEGETST